MRAIHSSRVVDREVARAGLDRTCAPFRPFTTLPTIDGYDVIDAATGRPVDHRDTRRSANGRAYTLNDAAKAGPRTLARALRAA